MKKLSLSLLIFFIAAVSMAQSDSSAQESQLRLFTYEFYVDAYYSYDFNQPYDHNRPDFLFQYNRSNQLGINMAMARVGYENGNFSANLGINTGDFPAANMAHERELLRMLYEANVGYTFLKKFKFTMGMFSSHMGFESALSFDNLLTSHSLTSEWTPYYLAGAKLEYMPNEKWLVGATVANGNQAITELEGNTNKLLGLQVQWSPNENVTVNYSNMYYNDDPDTATRFVFYNNLFSTITLIDKLDLVLGFDYGMVDHEISETTNEIYAASVLARYRINEQFAVAGRFEHYNDEDNEFISTPLGFGFVTNSFSLNLDYSPVERIKFRVEGRVFDNEYPTFRDDSDYNPNTSNTLLYTTQSANLLVAVQAKF